MNLIDLLGPDWMYAQSNGQMSYQPPASLGGGPPEPVGAPGCSGHGPGLHNPEMQNVMNTGPIPRGKHHRGPAYHDGPLAPVTVNLSPPPRINTFGRTVFRMQGDNPAQNHSASQGCIVMPFTVRSRIAPSSDRILRVIP